MRMPQEVLLFGLAICGLLTAGCRDDLQMADVVFRAECTIRSVQDSDGSWGGVRTTALAVMAYMSNDVTLRSFEFRQSMVAAAEWLIKKTEADEIKPDDMPIVANALCELYDLLPNPNLRFAALKCLSSVVRSQQPNGMWKDMLTTGWAALALNTARRLELRVPDDEEWMNKIPFELIAADGPDGAVATYLQMLLSRKGGKRLCVAQGFGGWGFDCGTADADFFAARVLRCQAFAPCDDTADVEMLLRVFRCRIERVKREMLPRMRMLSEGGRSPEDVERLCLAVMQVSWPSCRFPRPDHQGGKQ